jgi:hypothetical protein
MIVASALIGAVTIAAVLGAGAGYVLGDQCALRRSHLGKPVIGRAGAARAPKGFLRQASRIIEPRARACLAQHERRPKGISL